jgi:8-oxo-dGTP diphosphatase
VFFVIIFNVDHKKARAWLPSGGHVDIDEDPKTTVERECLEELGVCADFWASNPLFVTLTLIEGITSRHTDVSLWYVLKGDSNKAYEFDKREFNDIRWFHLNDVFHEKSDPHMGRFIQKLKGKL